MVHLPVEVLHKILTELQWIQWRGLAPASAVNRHWQAAAEYITWQGIEISTTEDIDHFVTYLPKSLARQQALRYITFLAKYFADPAHVAKTKKQKRQRSQYAESDSSETSINGSDNISNEDYDVSVSGNENCESDDHGTSDQDDESEDDWDENDWDNDVDPENSTSAYRMEHFRFFRDIRKIWDTLAACGSHLRVKSIYIEIDGWSMYEHLGRGLRDADAVKTYLVTENWLSSVGNDLPSLPSVEEFIMRPKGRTSVSLWSAIAACSIARTLPALQLLEIHGYDDDIRWEHVRRECRKVIAELLTPLYLLQGTVVLWFDHDCIANQWVAPTNLLCGGIDTLARAINGFSKNLTNLYVNVNHISADLFWDPRKPFSTSASTEWPNLKLFDVRTGFETATGQYWMRGESMFPDSTEHLIHYAENPGYPGSEPYSDSEEELRDEELGHWPAYYFRTRPEPDLFDSLAISIARAVYTMPKIQYMNLEFHSDHRGPDGVETHIHFENYKGWAFYFRSGNHARFQSKYFDNREQDPGPDTTEIERPRLEWVFMCPYKEVQWNQPEEANRLWKERFPTVDFDLVTWDHRNREEHSVWERRRDGKLICRSQGTFD